MLDHLCSIAQQAGDIVLAIYKETSLTIDTKSDGSPLTKADKASHYFICQTLSEHYPNIPVLSEEMVTPIELNTRKHWHTFFLIDPLDGTKEFIKKTDEFTINIALIQNGVPTHGIVHAPALSQTWCAQLSKGAYKLSGGNKIHLQHNTQPNPFLRIIKSRSHPSPETTAWIDSLNIQSDCIQTITAGSALKFGLIAEGKADIYPRFAPTMEWDTAAGHVLINEIGGCITAHNIQNSLQYNTMTLINPSFVAWRDRALWEKFVRSLNDE